jgi:hypothetical protein
MAKLTYQARLACRNKARHEITFMFSISGTLRMKTSHDLAATAGMFGQPAPPLNQIFQPPANRPQAHPRSQSRSSQPHKIQTKSPAKPVPNKSQVFDLAEGLSERCEEIKRAFHRTKRAFARVKRAFAPKKRAFHRVKRAFHRVKRAFPLLTRAFVRAERAFHRHKRALLRAKQKFTLCRVGVLAHHFGNRPLN